MILRWLIVILLTTSWSSVSLAACVNVVRGEPGTGGMGGTGFRDGDSPAMRPLDRDPSDGSRGTGGSGGIGGTGVLLADTIAVIGTITGFASICVNGLEIHYDPSTPVVMDGDTSSVSALTVGQQVSLQATPGKQGLSTARIVVDHTLSGPVTRLPDAQGGLQVMGKPVLLTVGTRGPLGNLKLGDPVRVSGLRDQQGQIRASRVDPVSGNERASISGRLARDDKGVRVDGVPVDALSPDWVSSTDMSLVVRGRWNGKALVADEVRSSASDGLLRNNVAVVLEGIVHRVDPSGDFETDSRRIVVPKDVATERAVQPGDRVIAMGRLDDRGRLVSDRIEVVSDVKNGQVRAPFSHGGRHSKDDDRDVEREIEREIEDTLEQAERDAQEADKVAREAAEKARDVEERSLREQSKSNEESLRRSSDAIKRREKTSEKTQIERVQKTEPDLSRAREERVEKRDRWERAERHDRRDRDNRPERVERPDRIERLDDRD